MTKNTDPFNMYDTVKCHTGNTVIYQAKNGRKLFIGGWTNGAIFDSHTFIIDLTGMEHKYWDVPFAYTANAEEFLPYVNTSYAGWLSLPFPDYGTPSKLNTLAQWQGITSKIKDQLNKGNDVLVACHGGHGRSGMFCAIVGYLLNIKTDKSWASPVEKIRKIHCEESVETFAQEKFVYAVLGLDIEITHVYVKPVETVSGISATYGQPCPICHNLSYQLDRFGMCIGCAKKYEDAPTRADLTLADIEANKMEHTCDHGSKCLGIWRAEKCGHITHDMIIYEGLCEVCWNKEQDEKEYAEKALEKKEIQQAQTIVKWTDPCAICGKVSHFSNKYGVCYDCQEELIQNGQVEAIHNSITDPYRYVTHKCDTKNPFCSGIVQADVCAHVVHDRDVVDGLCPLCLTDKQTGGAE